MRTLKSLIVLGVAMAVSAFSFAETGKNPAPETKTTMKKVKEHKKADELLKNESSEKSSNMYEDDSNAKDESNQNQSSEESYENKNE